MKEDSIVAYSRLAEFVNVTSVTAHKTGFHSQLPSMSGGASKSYEVQAGGGEQADMVQSMFRAWGAHHLLVPTCSRGRYTFGIETRGKGVGARTLRAAACMDSAVCSRLNHASVV